MHQSLSGAFVGRVRELAELHAGLEDVLERHGRLFLITGEPGIGKTRLAEQLAVYAGERRAFVAWGRCWEGGGAPAYWPWIQIFRSCLYESGHCPSDLVLDPGSPQVAYLVPELFEGNESSMSRSRAAASSDSEEERFRFFDSAVQLLSRN